MGRIKKAAGPKHEATVSPAIAKFVTKASTVALSQLPKHIKSFPRRWPFPKGDLYHWIPLFNRFDNILEQFNIEYGLHNGPQVRSFGRVLLLKGIAEESKAAAILPTAELDLDSMGYGADGDRELIEVVLNFSRRLLENCGNRSLYSSSERLGDLLNTTSLSVLTSTLQLAVRLAQRYYASRQRGANASQHLNNALLASHYSIDLEKVQKLACPFTKSSPSSTPSVASSTPSAKGKEKAQVLQGRSSPNVDPNDLLAFSSRSKTTLNGSAKQMPKSQQKETHSPNWNDWGSVLLTYYQSAPTPKDDQKPPATPTPTRRPSALSRPSRLSSSDESPEASVALSITKADDSVAGGMRHIEISRSVIANFTVEDILKDKLNSLSKTSRYELLTKVRSAHAIIQSHHTRQQLVGIRLLAITNLAYIYPDAVFQQRILQQDSDEPRRLQITYQLADLVHPPDNGAAGIPSRLQTIALSTLEALAKQKLKAVDVCAALSVNVNHGVLFYILRKAVAEMATEDSPDEIAEFESEDRQEALFALLEVLPGCSQRAGESLIAAGLLDVLVEVLNLRTTKAERSHPKVLTFLSSFLYSSRDAMQSLANSKGLDAISDLLDHEVRTSLERANNGEGLPEGFRTRMIDYQVPYFQQQSLRMLFKLITHMMTNGSGNLDRLLRNLIDSPQLLGGLRTVIVNARTFGSSVWAGAINIMSTFIHTEPTSYAVISEAGLSKGLLEAIELKSGPKDPMKAYLEYVQETDVNAPEVTNVDAGKIRNFMYSTAYPSRRLVNVPFAQEILPASDAILSVPQAFGAICLNPAGTKMLLESGALDSFFKTFESDDHIRSMAADRGELSRLLGSSFDELVRHHPNLKMPIMIAILNMVERMKLSLKVSSDGDQRGATLWLQGEDGKLLRSGAYIEHTQPKNDADVIMGEASPGEREGFDSTPVLPRQSEVAKSAEVIDSEEKSTPDVATRLGVAMNFLAGFFENSSLCSFFVEAGGAKIVMDTATASSLRYDFNVQDAGQTLAKVIHIMVEQKPHLVLPLILNATQHAADGLEPLYDFAGEHGFFSQYTSRDKTRSEKPEVKSGSLPPNGTYIVKTLLNIHTLCNILFEVFSGPIFASGRSGHTPFSQVNLADRYQALIKKLGLIHRVCVWEEILLQKVIPDQWKEATKMKGLGMGSDEADEIFGFLSGSSNTIRENSTSTNMQGSESVDDTTGVPKPQEPARLVLDRDEKTAQFRNAKTLRHLLSQVPSVIVLFSQNLGKALVPKRRPDHQARQNSYKIADAISSACLEQLSYELPKRSSCVKDRYAYWIVVLTSISTLMVEGNSIERPSPQVLTLMLQAFKSDQGLDAIREVLEVFLEEVKTYQTDKNASDGTARMTTAFSGLRIILGFYAQITSPKAITDSAQTHAITSSERDRGQPHYFLPSQFLVELRMAILPVVKSIWDSDFVDKAAAPTIKTLIDILKTALEGSDEQGAFKRSDEVPPSRKSKGKDPYTINETRANTLNQEGFEVGFAREALYRCMNSETFAREYCQAFNEVPEARNPIPAYDVGKTPVESTTDTPRHTDSGDNLPDPNTEDAMQSELPTSGTNLSLGDVTSDMVNSLLSQLQEPDDLEGSGPSIAPSSLATGLDPDPMAMSIDDLPSRFEGRLPSLASLHLPTGPTPASADADVATGQQQAPVTVDDLEEERSSVRQNLIDRALDVVNVHDDVTFELSDLITAAASKAPDAKTMRAEIGETLVQSLISLQMDEDFRPAGKKIASYANLLALVLQDKDFYESTVGQIVEYLEPLLGFIKIFSDQSPDEQSPWIGQILLVVEKLLAEDVQPASIQWTASIDGKVSEESLAEVQEPLVPVDAKIQLFEAIVEILPRIKKDESLALSVVRTLVILTRNREIASRLSERKNIQRLFVMVKQLSGMTNDRLPSTFMLLLRHIVEDDDTLRQIMRSEIVGRFETRPGRPTDTTVYVKQMYDLVLRSPQIFVEVTNEKLEIVRYESGQRPQTLQLKPEPTKSKPEPEPKPAKKSTADLEEVNAQAAEDPTPQVKTTEEVRSSIGEDSQIAVSKTKILETKAPVVEHPSGIIHYLLQELLSYKDVEDKDPTSTKEAPAVDPTDPPTEAEMAFESSPSSGVTSTATPAEVTETKKPEKQEFKSTEHPIYVYRCFILQCLAELLHCYNRTKIEFINFSRKADPKAMTPSKPRSGVLNYLLNDVVPVGSLSNDETIAYRKKNTTSNWAMSAIVSLCLRTNENGHSKKQGSIDEDDESDLLFVRKFVLEHALKAYKDAMVSEEHADVKYARLLDIADLFNRLLHGRLVPSMGAPPPITESGFQKSIAKLMFEKNFISALTSSIADVDLNFPGSKRAIKYILKPLKALTSTAVVLSQESDLSTTPGLTTEDDEISTATSVSDVEDEREETPDLFRNSTLGMFEPGREEESSSGESEEDEEMYENGYEDEMDYEDGMDRDDDEVISDEDEDLGEAGPMEGLSGDHSMNVEVVIDEDDDDPSDDDDDDDDQDDSDNDMDDDDEEIEVIDEVTGDNENHSLADGDDEGWQDEDAEDMAEYNEAEFDPDLSPDQDAESAVRDIVRGLGGPAAALQRLEGLEDGSPEIQMGTDAGRYMDEMHREEEEDDEDDDDEDAEEDVEDEDVIYQPEFDDDDDSGLPEPPFGWDPDDEGITLPRHHHHHHHPRRVQDPRDPWSAGFPGSTLDRGMSLYRSHRPTGVARAADDNANPLLQRADRSGSSRSSRGIRSNGLSFPGGGFEDYWVHGMESARRPGGILPGESPLSFLNNLIASVDQTRGLGFSAIGGGPNGAIQLNIAHRPGDALSLPRELQMALGIPRHIHPELHPTHRDEHRPATFQPALTTQRWREEALLLYGTAHLDKANHIINSLLRLLVPPALEKKKREEEELKRLREAAEKRQKEEQEAKEKTEQEKRDKEAEEERLAAAARAADEAEAAARAEEEVHAGSEEHGDVIEDDGAMEGVESTQTEESIASVEGGEAQATEEPAAAEPIIAGPSEPAERVRTTIRGRELDITGLGIDLAYLDALPEDIREEVLMSQLAIQRSEAQAAGQEPTDISREFLEALPAEIREELLQQEAQDRRRREREEARRRQQPAGGPAVRGPEDMDPASFLASLDPTLRQHVLMEQDEEMLAHLPEEIAAEARALGGSHHRFAGIGRGGRGSAGLLRQLEHARGPPPPATDKPPRRQTVQMLDKAGVATLLRLMFMPQVGSSRSSLNGILHDVSKNRQNRAEVINLLLSILQDGSADVNAVERSFTHLSLRAKQQAAPKTPQSLKRTLTGPIASAANSMEATPLMVIQQCLSALVSLTHYNLHVPSFFLTEHEVTSCMKTKANRKGKGKETRASKFALNALLSLLDRKLIMDSSGCMEQLSSLLQSVTHPLTMLLRKDKEKADENPDGKVVEATTILSDRAAILEAAATSDQPTAETTDVIPPSAEESTSLMADVQAITGQAGEDSTQSRGAVEDPQTVKESQKTALEKAAEDEKKKVRTLTPPVVPEENLRLVVNILAARECSAKTFRDTLSTINNLSGIPGAKEVFGKGLIEQAQDLGQSILQDLDELVPQIKSAESGTDIQGMALAKFSPASSDQAKLLRVLTALDYLFDPKRNGGKTKPLSDDESQLAESSNPREEDILTTLYENPTFGSLWNKLSECLSTIRQGEGMLNVATILLPLVEALMVVCKNTTLKDVPMLKAAKEFSITSPPPESFMESLFFKFTEDHRKILNDLVRHNPKLMSGTFSLLVKNPKVLEFDNKRNYFTRRLHSRGAEARHPQPPLQLSVRRDQVFLDSFKFLSFKSGDEIKYGKLSIRFHGEEGVDAGGVTREWFQVLSRQMFNPDYALFIPVASDRTTFHPNKLSKVNDEHLMFFKFIGRIIGKALYEGRALDCHFSRAVYKRILGKTVSIKDMETLDLEYYKSLLWMLENDITDIITETFSVETDDFGVQEIVDLVGNGRNVPVTDENKHEYVQKVVEYRLTGSVQAQLEQFLKGFHDIVPPELIAIFNEQELELLISGLPEIDVDDWKNHTEYHNYQAASPQIQWFWRAVRSYDKEERAKLLQFVTGTSKVPLNGFGQLEGMNGFSRFNIHRDYGNKDRLPSSHTCFNQLDLPEYDSYEQLRQQVYTAMTAGSEYFGFA